MLFPLPGVPFSRGSVAAQARAGLPDQLGQSPGGLPGAVLAELQRQPCRWRAGCLLGPIAGVTPRLETSGPWGKRSNPPHGRGQCVPLGLYLHCLTPTTVCHLLRLQQQWRPDAGTQTQAPLASCCPTRLPVQKAMGKTKGTSIPPMPVEPTVGPP